MPISTPVKLCKSGSGSLIMPASISQRLNTPLRPKSTIQA
jgi:hypothetical protein